MACEPFSQWVIEDRFPRAPSLEKVGAELVSDVLPYEEMKLRMLNGSHSFLAYLGYLAAYQHIGDCMQDADFVRAARHLMLAEQAPTLQVPNVDLAQYADSLLRRFRNRALKHRTAQIAVDGTQSCRSGCWTRSAGTGARQPLRLPGAGCRRLDALRRRPR